MQPAQPGVKQLHVIGDLGHGADGGARGPHRIFAVDGDGRRDPLDLVHLRPVHAVHELPGIGGECFDVAPLALGIQGIKGQ